VIKCSERDLLWEGPGTDRSSQATELTLEDRITERLKAYQRQLAQVTEKDEL
jgi:hypothetical protein